MYPLRLRCRVSEARRVVCGICDEGENGFYDAMTAFRRAQAGGTCQRHLPILRPQGFRFVKRTYVVDAVVTPDHHLIRHDPPQVHGNDVYSDKSGNVPHWIVLRRTTEIGARGRWSKVAKDLKASRLTFPLHNAEHHLTPFKTE